MWRALRTRRVLATLAIPATAVLGGCVQIFTTLEPRVVRAGAEATAAPVVIHAPLKAHLADGTTVIFREGATIANKQIV